MSHQRHVPDRFSLARLAFRRRDVRLAEAAHSEDRLAGSLREAGTRGRHLADMVLGATDGIVTTFAVVAAAAGASLSPGITLVIGSANLVADGLSMAMGNYLGAKSQQQYWREEKRREAWEIERIPAAEEEEIRRIYRDKGFEGDTLERIVGIITMEKQQWLAEMMREELGIHEERIAPLASGVVTFIAFALAGFVPLFSYLFTFLSPSFAGSAPLLSFVLTAVALFGIGALQVLMTRRPWWKSGLQSLAVGGFAAFSAFLVGYLLRAWLG
jgi:VIT1/CCC1 family predicted Fe2+/Mn2+ transporter